jgi:hypothetical protein
VQVLKNFVLEVANKSQQGAQQVPDGSSCCPPPPPSLSSQVLIACDALRDDVLPPLGIRLEDQQVRAKAAQRRVAAAQLSHTTQGAPAVWKLEDPAALQQVMTPPPPPTHTPPPPLELDPIAFT